MSVDTKPAPKLKKVPRSALTFAGSPLKFADGEGEADKGLSVEILARSGAPLQHWYWGQVIHDMTGFTPAKPKLALDYCHDDGQIIGYTDSFAATPEGLVCQGKLVSLGDDRAKEVYDKGKLGVPYEASIFFEPLSTEELMPGAKAEVNGQELIGPAVIFRKWSLRGLAVCPYGYDGKTETKFSAAGGEIEVSLTAVGEAPAEPPAPVEPKQFTAADLASYITRFGGVDGPKFLSEGLPLEQCFERALKAKDELLAAEAAKLTAAGKQIAELQQKLAAAGKQLGEEKPVTFADGEKPQGAGSPQGSGLTPGLQQFAAGLKFAGGK